MVHVNRALECTLLMTLGSKVHIFSSTLDLKFISLFFFEESCGCELEESLNNMFDGHVVFNQKVFLASLVHFQAVSCLAPNMFWVYNYV